VFASYHADRDTAVLIPTEAGTARPQSRGVASGTTVAL
jgi:hypothetical protein